MEEGHNCRFEAPSLPEQELGEVGARIILRVRIVSFEAGLFTAEFQSVKDRIAKRVVTCPSGTHPFLPVSVGSRLNDCATIAMR